MISSQYLDTENAALYLGQSTRWMRRHWPDLVRNGVQCFRVPKGSPKGRLIFDKASLENYLKACRVLNAG